MTPKRITHAWLVERNACADQLAIFDAEWPDSADLTRANLMRAAELQLDLNWLAEKVLTAPARRAYDEATAPAWPAYSEATAAARRAYKEAKATALADALGLPEEVTR